MPYESVDQLQRTLTKDVFHYAKDSKKAAGRALGTLVEIITFYLLKTWGFERAIAIERGLREFGNPLITHNVEYSLHPVRNVCRELLKDFKLPLTSSKILKHMRKSVPELLECQARSQVLLTRDGIVRNACVLTQSHRHAYVALIGRSHGETFDVEIVAQYQSPYAMFECKRVGIEEGNKKGPQTIEKAKQGAYVARTVSSLQRIRSATGDLHGVIPRTDGSFVSKPYAEMIAEVIASADAALLKDFVLTVGVVSNHGNWFTSENQNKEMMVLAQSYDWLLFLTDQGLAEFVHDVLVDPTSSLAPAKAAFLKSYTRDKKKNEFTKVQMSLAADLALQAHFHDHLPQIEKWFNVIAPVDRSIRQLKSQIDTLSIKDWPRIHGQ